MKTPEEINAKTESEENRTETPGSSRDPGHSAYSDEPVHPEETDQSGKPAHSEEPGEPGHSGQPGEAEEAGQTREPGQNGEVAHSEETGQPGEAEEAEETGQPGEAGEPDAAGPVSAPRRRVFLLILDGAGVGALPDAARYGDEGAATLPHVSRQAGGLQVPFLEKLGLGNIVRLKGVEPAPSPLASYGSMGMLSSGKDTTTGHWEIAGLVLPRPFPLYPDGFPPEITEKFEKAIGRKILGNKAASGTEIIAELGERHLQTGSPIVYTSADSVFQIAAHEDIAPVEKLYYWCAKAREILTGKHSLSRVIARPFKGQPGNFIRTAGRRDFSLQPPRPTILDLLSADGMPVTLIGKVKDIFSGRGITRYIPVNGGNEAVARGVMEAVETVGEGLVWANFGDFDTLYGHRNDVPGFARALSEFNFFLGTLMERLQGTHDILIITADHGCDPTWPGTDHTREYVPLLVMNFAGGEAGRRENAALAFLKESSSDDVCKENALVAGQKESATSDGRKESAAAGHETNAAAAGRIESAAADGRIANDADTGSKDISAAAGRVPGVALGTRKTMSDLGATIMDLLNIENNGDISGTSFRKELPFK